MSWVEVYLLAVVHIGTIPAVGFPLFYRRSPWRSTEVGKALMLKGASLAALFVLSIIGFWWPFPGYAYIHAAITTLVVVGITYQFAVMRSLQKRGRDNVTPDGEF